MGIESFFGPEALDLTINEKWDTRHLQSTDYVQVIFPNGINSQFASAFTGAAAFWNNILTTSPVSPISFPSGFSVGANLPGCGVNFNFAAGSSIQGLTIFASVEFIDGVGSILGQAGPCGFTGSNPAFPRVGVMAFDSADVQSMLNNGSLQRVIIHEMGHVLGIGGTWQSNNLVANPCQFQGQSCNPTYRGTQGNAGFAQLGGSGNAPVANTGGAGTFNAHWREATFGNELMTGFINSGSNPVSIMTVRSLVDLGYNVDTSKAEAYSIPKGEFEVGEIDLSGDLLTIEPLAMEPILERIEQEQAAAAKNSELGIFIGVVAGVLALFIALVVLAVMKMKRNNEKAIAEIKAESQMSPAAPNEVEAEMNVKV